MFKRVAAVVAGLALVVAACGDDDGGGDLSGAEEAVVDAIVAGMTGDPDPENPFADQESARCVAVGIVEDLGIERLAEVGLTADTDQPQEVFGALTDDEIDGIVDIAFGCVDVEEEMAVMFADEGVSMDSARCLARELNDTDFFRAAFRAGMTGDDTYDPSTDPEFMTVMLEAFTGCLTAEEMAGIMGG